MHRSLTFLMCAAQVLSSHAQQSGDLDNTFSSDGLVTTDFNAASGGDVAYGMAVQPDGRIVVCGRSTVNGASAVSMVRYLPNGDLDPEFGTGGRVITDLGTQGNVALAVALQTDGRILLAGYLDSTSTTGGMAVLRYLGDGTLDNSFANGGVAYTDVGEGFENAYAIQVQPDGRIVVAGGTGYGVSQGMAVLRYTMDGTLDPSFNGDGIWTYNAPGSGDELRALVLADGGIVVGGPAPGLGAGCVIMRLNDDGSLDTGFGDAGFAATGITGVVNALALQDDGRIVAVTEDDSQLSVARFGTDGAPDASFATDGLLAFTGTTYSWGRAVQMMPDGRIVVGGYAGDGSGTNLLVAMIQPDGTLDPGFGGDGFQLTPAGTVPMVRALAVQGDGKVLLAGWRGVSGNYLDYLVARYHTDVNLTMGVEEAPSAIADLLVQPSLFTDRFTLEYTLPQEDHTNIELRDGSGRLVRQLMAGQLQPSGTHRLEVDATGLPAGAYVLTVRGNEGAGSVRVVKE